MNSNAINIMKSKKWYRRRNKQVQRIMKKSIYKGLEKLWYEGAKEGPLVVINKD